MEKNILEQGYAITFCVKLGEGTASTYEKIQKSIGNGYHMCKYFSDTKTL
jgi:hypothetical protein